MGVHPFEDLPKVLHDRTAEALKLVTGIAQEATRQAGAYVASETPVDKGVARSNWIATIDKPAEGTIPAYAPGSHLGIGEEANLRAAMNQHDQVTAQFDAAKNTSLHVTNNVDYIGELNYTDHSAQASPGFFERAIPFAVSKIRGMWKLKA